MITPHSKAWYERLSNQQEGYFYPWHSTLGEGDGETAYMHLVKEHISSTTRVLDVGCGHGDVVLDLASFCHSIVGYDQVRSYIDIAEKNRARMGISNTEFLHHDSHPTVNGGHAKLPASDDSVDLIISRRGPTHWFEDARRICSPGAPIIQLNPMGMEEEPVWNSALPDILRLHQPESGDANAIVDSIEQRLAACNLSIHDAWTFDVPEWFHTPIDLYRFLTFGEDVEAIPAWTDVESDLTRTFLRYAESAGLKSRHRRFLWKSLVAE